MKLPGTVGMPLAVYLRLPEGYVATRFPGSILIEAPGGVKWGLPAFDGHGDRGSWAAAAARVITTPGMR